MHRLNASVVSLSTVSRLTVALFTLIFLSSASAQVVGTDPPWGMTSSPENAATANGSTASGHADAATGSYRVLIAASDVDEFLQLHPNVALTLLNQNAMRPDSVLNCQVVETAEQVSSGYDYTLLCQLLNPEQRAFLYSAYRQPADEEFFAPPAFGAEGPSFYEAQQLSPAVGPHTATHTGAYAEEPAYEQSRGESAAYTDAYSQSYQEYFRAGGPYSRSGR